MRVLLGHNYYRSASPSGEDSVFRNELRLLQERGVEVIPYERFNDDIDDSNFFRRLALAHSGTWSNESYAAISELIEKTRPNIAHFHNTFPLISPSVYAACQDHGVPVVQTLHNYRLICPAALLYRNGRPCEECLGKPLIPALLHRCYRDSLPATGVLVWMILRNRLRGTYKHLVNRYIAPTNFVAKKMIDGGLPEILIEVKPHFVPNPPSAGAGGGNYAVYVGRLSEEKGLHTLLSAWHHVDGLPLKLIGDGALRNTLQGRAERERLRVEFLGIRSRADVLEIVGKADLLILPTESYEVFGLAVIEAYACGTPVVVSRIGGLAEIVIDGETGATFEPGNPRDLANKVMTLWSNPSCWGLLRSKARDLFDTKYNADRNFDILMGIYERAFTESRRDRQYSI